MIAEGRLEFRAPFPEEPSLVAGTRFPMVRQREGSTPALPVSGQRNVFIVPE